MIYSEKLRLRYEAIVRTAHRHIVELVDIVAERARAQHANDPELLARTERLVKSLLQCQKDTWLLRAAIVQEQIDGGFAGDLEDLEIPDFMPEKL